jgi:hypothetical protein
MKKIVFIILLFLIAVLAIAQPQPPANIIINNGGPVYPDTPTLFNWDDCSGATSYGLQVFSGSATLLDITGIPVSEYTVSPNVFSANTYCYCRVNATGPGGTSSWSSYFHFTVTQHITLNPPSLLLPVDSTLFIQLTPSFDWSDVQGATMYRLQISTVPTFTTIILNISGLVNSGYVTSSGILTICTRYYWRVKAYNSGDSSSWSVVRTFTTVCPSGVNQISSKIPAEYKLYNNYPNPFNPSTIIRFQIKESEFVSLKVYDILGKEIANLINEYLKPGIYEVPFSINHYTNNGSSSGIYFYRLQSGDFSDTKKMLFIK